MKKKKVEQLLNYNGEPVPEGYVMVPTVPDDLDIKCNVRNKKCVISLPIPGTAMSTRAVLRAVPESQAAIYRKQYNSWQNDQLRHFPQAHTVSSDAAKDAYGIERSTDITPESIAVGKDNALKAAQRLIDEAPSLATGMYFKLTGLSGKDFMEAMHVEKSRSAKIQENLKDIFTKMIFEGAETVEFKANHTRNDAYYLGVLKEHSEELLDTILSFFE
ncbi:MAG: hypothetical protein K6F35_12675 [Lachnospiraceae bacterium]|nr:hypothetical protein [Lachnospiraceae bacterium]